MVTKLFFQSSISALPHFMCILSYSDSFIVNIWNTMKVVETEKMGRRERERERNTVCRGSKKRSSAGLKVILLDLLNLFEFYFMAC